MTTGLHSFVILLLAAAHISDGNSPFWGIHPPVPVQQRPIDAMVDVTNNLGVAVLQDYAYTRSNFAFSPYGAASVLVVLYEGARGESARQIHNTLRLPWNTDVIRIGFRDIHRHLRGYFSHEGYLSGLLLSRNHTNLLPEYRRVLRFYGYDIGLAPGNSFPPTTNTTTSTTTSTTTTTTSTTTTTTTTTTSTPTPTENVSYTVNTHETMTTIQSRDMVTGSNNTTESTAVMHTTPVPATETVQEPGTSSHQSSTTPTAISPEHGFTLMTLSMPRQSTNMPRTSVNDIATAGASTTVLSSETASGNTLLTDSTSPLSPTTSAEVTSTTELGEETEESSPTVPQETTIQETQTMVLTEETGTVTLTEPTETAALTEQTTETMSSTGTVLQTMAQTEQTGTMLPTEQSTITATLTEEQTETETLTEEQTERETQTEEQTERETPTEEQTEGEALTEQTERQTPTEEQTETETLTEQTEGEALTEEQTETPTEEQTETETPTEEQTEGEALTEEQTERETPTEGQTETEIPTEEQTEGEAPTEEQTERRTPTEEQTETETPTEEQTEGEALTEEQTETETPTEQTETPTEEQTETETLAEEQTEAETLTEEETEAEALIEEQTEAETLTEEQTEAEALTEEQTEAETLTEEETETSTEEPTEETTVLPVTDITDNTVPDRDMLIQTMNRISEPTTMPSIPIPLANDLRNTTQHESSTSTSGNRTRRSIADISLQLQNGMFDSQLSRGYQMYNQLPRRNFLVDGVTEELVPVMSYTALFRFAYLQRLHAQVLEFPLDDERYRLLLLLPVERRGLRQLIYDLASCSLREIYNALRLTRVQAIIPSFMVEGFVILTPTLQQLGIWDVFDPRRADLSGMSNDPDLYVRNIEQSVTVVIRNYVKILDIQTRTMAARTTMERFIVTHPFLYFVLDTDTHVALMAGKIVDPLNSRIY